jgi:hypothetical protein
MEAVVWIAAGIVELGLAALLLTLNGRTWLSRIFAAYLLVDGTRSILRGMAEGEAFVSVRLVTPYLLVAASLLILYFGAAYRHQHRPSAWSRFATRGLVAFGSLYLIAMGVLHASGASMRQLDDAGFFLPVDIAWFWGPGILAFLMVADARTMEGIRRRRALILGVMALCFEPLAFSLHMAIPGLMTHLDATTRILYAASILPVLAVIASLVRLLGAEPEVARQARVALGMLIVPVLSVASMAAASITLPLAAAETFMLVSMSLWHLATAVLITYAILRGEIFGMEARLKVSLSRGTVYGTFVAVFLVASQLVEQFIGHVFDGGEWVVGGLAAGLLLFALTPLQRFADRFADRVMPSVEVPSRLDAKARAAAYRKQVVEAWSDGQVGLKERRMLDGARIAFGLSHEEAGRIEANVVRGKGRRAPPA